MAMIMFAKNEIFRNAKVIRKRMASEEYEASENFVDSQKSFTNTPMNTRISGIPV